MTAYYNEYDAKAAAWLRELIKAGLIAPGEVDERSIIDVKADDLRGFSQCHFFAGIGGWSYALRLAGWADDRPCWTGSPPCQPFSNAGKQKAQADARHLWPVFFNLIRECKPANIFGEQVEAAIRTGWLDDLQDDLEAENYATGKVILPACSVGAPHIRQRIWFVAERVGDTEHNGLPCVEKSPSSAETGNQCEKGTVVSSESEGTGSSVVSGTLRNWENPDWLYCRDGKWRPVPTECKFLLLADGFWYRMDDVLSELIKKAIQGVEYYAEITGTRPEEILRNLWEADGTEAIQRETARPWSVFKNEVLWAILRGESSMGEKPESEHTRQQKKITEADRRMLRDLQSQIESEYPSLRRKPAEQRQSEPANLVSELSQFLAQCEQAYGSYSARKNEGGFPLAGKCVGRVGLLRGYGNAIVPQVAAEVIKAYMEDMPK